jgi:hypothetical protein
VLHEFDFVLLADVNSTDAGLPLARSKSAVSKNIAVWDGEAACISYFARALRTAHSATPAHASDLHIPKIGNLDVLRASKAMHVLAPFQS